MNIPSEAVGAVPQGGVNPLAKTSPQPQAEAPLSTEDMEFFRNDPEIVAAVSKFMGRTVTLENVPDEMLVQLAGMVQKLGVDGAVQMAQKTIPPDVQQKLRSAV